MELAIDKFDCRSQGFEIPYGSLALSSIMLSLTLREAVSYKEIQSNDLKTSKEKTHTSI